MFCDELKIKVIAGKGGDGCSSFRREKFVPRGGPDGGDGGHGGDIILKVNNNLNTLSHLKSQKTYRAESGKSGRGQNMYGKKGEPMILEVPVGTVVFTKDKSMQLADLSKIGEEVIIAKGGRGGLGNAKFVSSIHQAPHFKETGEPGEEIEILLELKLVADVGLIGLPSSGKSTLISVVSNARPRIAAYQFTTLIPNLGVVDMQRFGGSVNENFIVADIPGLIEGASQGKGLGYQFLRHVARTKLLIHIVDSYLENADKNYKIIIEELKKFDKKLAKREEIIVLNKIDLIDEKTLKKRIKEIKKVSKKKIFPISALTREGLKPLVFEIIKKLQKIKKKELSAPPEKTEKSLPVLKPHLTRVKWEIEKIIKEKDYKIFCIVGKRIEQLAVMTDISDQEGLERMYHYFRKMGLQDAVERKGATYGDFIKILNKRIPYRRL